MIRVALVRGKYLNNFEGQNFVFKKGSGVELSAISSKAPIHTRLPFKTITLPSLSDFFDFRVGKIVANRTIGDLQNLSGLENLANEFEIFHTADPHYYYSYQLAKLRKSGKIRTLLCTWCETIPHNNESTYAKARIKRFTMKYVDHYVTLSNRAKKALLKEGVDKKNITVIPMGVDLDKFKDITEKSKEKTKTILFVGRLVPEKGVLDAYNAYKEVQSDANFIIVGEGPLREKLQEMIRKDGLTQAVSILTSDYEKMPYIYQMANVILIPSKRIDTWEEQYGMVAVEALASGLPIIAYRSGALPEVLSKAALFVREGDVSGLGDTLATLIKDEKKMTKLGTIARRRAVKLFDRKSTAKRYEKLYETLSRDTDQK